MGNKKISLIIPTIRDLTFLEEWKEILLNHKDELEIIIVEDFPNHTVKIPRWLKARVFCHKDINKTLGKDKWIIQKKGDAIRSFGFLMAKGDIIITIDDDCFPANKHFFNKHLLNLHKHTSSNKFYDIFKKELNLAPRGYPYEIRKPKEVVLNLGLWTHNPDFDAITELMVTGNWNKKVYNPGTVDEGLLIPISIMNVAFKRKILPAYYQPICGPYERFSDIWSGFIVKKIIDHLGDCMTVGEPYVVHKRRSNTLNNLQKEVKGLTFNETMWRVIDACEFSRNTYSDCYKEMAQHFFNMGEELNNKYLIKLSKAMVMWLKWIKKLQN